MNTESSAPSQFNEREIDKILAMGWEAAALENPMRLAVRPYNALQQLREMVRDCLAKEIPTPVICQRILRGLLANDPLGKPRSERDRTALGLKQRFTEGTSDPQARITTGSDLKEAPAAWKSSPPQAELQSE